MSALQLQIIIEIISLSNLAAKLRKKIQISKYLLLKFHYACIFDIFRQILAIIEQSITVPLTLLLENKMT